MGVQVYELGNIGSHVAARDERMRDPSNDPLTAAAR
jgi:hypothetical protein